MDLSTVSEGVVHGAAYGLLHAWLAWWFLKMIEDQVALRVAGIVSILVCATALVAWNLRDPMLAHPPSDAMVSIWFAVLGAAMTVGTLVRGRQLQ